MRRETRAGSCSRRRRRSLRSAGDVPAGRHAGQGGRCGRRRREAGPGSRGEARQPGHLLRAGRAAMPRMVGARCGRMRWQPGEIVDQSAAGRAGPARRDWPVLHGRAVEAARRGGNGPAAGRRMVIGDSTPAGRRDRGRAMAASGSRRQARRICGCREVNWLMTTPASPRRVQREAARARGGACRAALVPTEDGAPRSDAGHTDRWRRRGRPACSTTADRVLGRRIHPPLGD